MKGDVAHGSAVDCFSVSMIRSHTASVDARPASLPDETEKAEVPSGIISGEAGIGCQIENSFGNHHAGSNRRGAVLEIAATRRIFGIPGPWNLNGSTLRGFPSGSVITGGSV